MSTDFLLHLFGVEKKIAGLQLLRDTTELVWIVDEALVAGGRCYARRQRSVKSPSMAQGLDLR